MKVAFVFPGQGAQEVGMGRSLASSIPEARAVFDTVDAALGDETPLSSLCFEGPAEALTLTANTQPAILAMSMACLAALRARLPTLQPTMLAGHSLGEYSALVAAGGLDLPTAARLLRLRGRAMQEAVAPGEGAMAAVIALDDDSVERLCAEVQQEMPGHVVQAANFNCPGQVVVAGSAEAVAFVRRYPSDVWPTLWVIEPTALVRIVSTANPGAIVTSNWISPNAPSIKRPKLTLTDEAEVS